MLDPGEQRLFGLLSVFSESRWRRSRRWPPGPSTWMAMTCSKDSARSSTRAWSDESTGTGRPPPDHAGHDPGVRHRTARRGAGVCWCGPPRPRCLLRRLTEAQWSRLTSGEREAASDRMARPRQHPRRVAPLGAGEGLRAPRSSPTACGSCTTPERLVPRDRVPHHRPAGGVELHSLHARTLGSETLPRAAWVLMVVRGPTEEACWARGARGSARGEGGAPILSVLLLGWASLHVPVRLREWFRRSRSSASPTATTTPTRHRGTPRAGGQPGVPRPAPVGIGAPGGGHGRLWPATARVALFQLGNNPGVVCFTTSAMVLWMLGFPTGPETGPAVRRPRREPRPPVERPTPTSTPA